MTRQKQFDPDVVLERAMNLFWVKGYEATSVQDLVDTMEINRFSLYATFGDKHELYLAVCDKYSETIISMLLDELENSELGLAAVRNFFDFIITVNDEMPRGCLMVNAAVELALTEEAVVTRVQKQFKRNEDALTKALCRAKDLGELQPDVIPRDQARHLSVVAHGLLVNLKTGMTSRQAKNTVRIALRALSI